MKKIRKKMISMVNMAIKPDSKKINIGIHEVKD
jgi:hypothetical protein